MSAGNDREFIDHLQNKEKGGRPMKCPLSITGQIGDEKEFIGAAADCLKEECAWWDKELECCHIASLSIGAKVIGDLLSDIHGKMPHEGQFRK